MARKDISSEETDKSIDHLIREVREAFKKLKCREMSDILSQFGKENNEDLADLILSWNTYFEDNHSNDDEDEYDESGHKIKKPVIIPWIDILGRSFKVTMLLSLEQDQTYDYLRNKQKYQIIVNRSNTDTVFYANTTYNFDNKEERDRTYEDLKTRLEAFSIKFY